MVFFGYDRLNIAITKEQYPMLRRELAALLMDKEQLVTNGRTMT